MVRLIDLKPGTSRHEWHLGGEFFEAFGNSEILGADIEVSAKVNSHGPTVDVACEIRGEVTVACDRCLEDLKLPVETSFEEDFAESFTYLFDSPTSVQDLAQKAPNCPAIQKLRYLQRVLMECFSVNASIFYAIDPSQPSAWAQNGVVRYLELFPNDTFLASGSQPFYPGYQSGTARWDFAQAAYLTGGTASFHRPVAETGNALRQALV